MLKANFNTGPLPLGEYNLEHSCGPDKKSLGPVFAILIILPFLVDQV
ncbi:hypothetical protein JWJ90_19470 [Desulfobulbus rhabdoformis]|nr:hypothetical protein [Desulfobulbus rhabdoformis]MBM9616450.1 hypothetical protein [Desulfobulbus rhabdoformis]